MELVCSSDAKQFSGARDGERERVERSSDKTARLGSSSNVARRPFVLSSLLAALEALMCLCAKAVSVSVLQLFI
jgi:hypothetical protein